MLIKWFAPSITGEEVHFVDEVLKSGFINDGPQTREFELQIANFVGAAYAVAVPSGTVAVGLALLACGLDGDDVIVPDLTFIATPNAVRLAGGSVILADVSRSNFCLTKETVAAALTPKTKFVVTVEVNGRSPDYAELLEFCNGNGLILVTDSCEALGSKHNGKSLGTHGKAGCFSFSPNKIITTGQGGMVVTDDPDVHKRLRELKNQGLFGRGTGGNDVFPASGFNFKFTDIQAAIGLAQLKVLKWRLDKCRQRTSWYRASLAGVPVEFPETNPDEVCLWTDVLVEDRDRVASKLRENGIDLREFWLPLHKQPMYMSWDSVGASEISRKGMWLPSSFDITEDQVGQVSKCIREAFGG